MEFAQESGVVHERVAGTGPFADAPVSALSAAPRATLAYHDLLELPLTAVECWRYVLRPRSSVQVGQRASVQEDADGLARSHAPKRPVALGALRARTLGHVSLRDVEEALQQLVTTGVIETRNGFFFLPGRGWLVEERIAKHARSQEKWKRLRRIVFWLQAVPFLRGVAGTGSLACENVRESSDLDVLVIASPNRVWTVRFLLTILLDLFRLRRRPSGPTKDRVCLNHYLAADALEFPYQSLYTALEYARLVPLLGEETCRAFRSANRPWMLEYLVQVFPDALSHRKTRRESFVLRLLQAAGELLLVGPLGALVERGLAGLLGARIAGAEATTAPGGRVVATEAHAEFHPHSREAPLLAAFNARMEAFGLADLFGGQKDSGLTYSPGKPSPS